jgi:peptide/nickel transport system substrate-binding protein
MIVKYNSLFLAVLAIILATGTACAPAATPKVTQLPEVTLAETATPTVEPEEPAAPVMLRFAVEASALGTADPHFAAGTQDRILADMVFNGLLRYQPGNAPVIEPDLAESIPEPQMVNGKQTWTFRLRKGVMCHPGPETKAYELTADDVVYSLQKSTNPDRSAYAGEYGGMTVEKVDSYTVKIILDTPLSSVLLFPKLADYAGGFIVCKRAGEAMGDEAFETHPVGTGPFMFESYTPGERVRLVANEAYFRGRPLLAGVELLFMPDIESREAALKSGEVDVIYGLAESEWLERMEQEEDILVDVHGVGEVGTVHFNTTVKPLNDVQVRRAIAYALDRDEFRGLFGPRLAGNVYSPVPAQFLPGGLTQEEAETLGLDYAVDLEKAGQLLAEAGYSDGFSLDVVTSELIALRKPYESLRDQLAQIGIQLEIEVVDHPTMHKLIREDVNPIVFYIAWRPNADVYLTRFFHSDSIVVTGAKPDTNFSHYDQIDNLIEAARLETDPGMQIELWKHAQIKVLEDTAAYPLFYLSLIHARRVWVDYGHEIAVSMALYPQITEKTRIVE